MVVNVNLDMFILMYCIDEMIVFGVLYSLLEKLVCEVLLKYEIKLIDDFMLE